MLEQGWGDASPDRAAGAELVWLHVPRGGGELRLTVLSESPLHYAGHWLGGVVRRCQGDGCKSCRAGVGRQHRYVVAALDRSSGLVGVLELGQQAAEQLRLATDLLPAMRGAAIRCRRDGTGARAKIVVEGTFDPLAPRGADLPRCPDLGRWYDGYWRRQEEP